MLRSIEADRIILQPFFSFLFVFKVHVGSLRPTSRGYVKLKSLDPYEYPIINPNYLSTEEDREDLRNCIKLTREIFNQKALDAFRKKELRPGIRSEQTINLQSSSSCIGPQI